jgi:hypothetical protein
MACDLHAGEIFEGESLLGQKEFFDASGPVPVSGSEADVVGILPADNLVVGCD